MFIVEPKDENDNLVLETMRGLYGMGTRDFVTAVDEGHIILVKELENKEDYPDTRQMASNRRYSEYGSNGECESILRNDRAGAERGISFI